MSDEMIPETEFSTIPFLGFFVGSIDTKVVGAARRGARPDLRFFVFEGRGVSIWHPSASDPLIT